MTTVAQYFGKREPSLTASHPSLALDCGVGIELELEGSSEISARMWNCVEDGSLRNGCEMVCARPYNGQELFRAIHNLSEAVRNSHAEGTWRCSTHVHMDMRDADSNILKKVILGYAFYEKMLFKCSGFHRFRSNFCPAFSVVQAQVMNASSAFNLEGADFFQSLVHNWDKYTSLNLLPLEHYGSVEFRISEPKWKRGQLLNLVNRFLVLKRLAIEHRDQSNEEFVETLNTIRFTPMIEHLPLDYTPNQNDLDEGYRLARDILYCRSSSVQVVGRIRVRNESGAEAVIDLRLLPDFYNYFGYVRRGGRSVFDAVMAQYNEQYTNTRMATESELREMLQILRDSGHSDNNITGYIPDQLEHNMEEFL